MGQGALKCLAERLGLRKEVAPVRNMTTMINSMQNLYFRHTVLLTSSLKTSMSLGTIHHTESLSRSSHRGFPDRKALSTSFSELLPSIAARKLNFKDGSPSVLYKQGAHTFSCSHCFVRPRASRRFILIHR